MANQLNGTINYDNDTYNLHFDYETENEDGGNDKHEMWFTDAATIFNILRFSDESGFAGILCGGWVRRQKIWTFMIAGSQMFN